MDEEKDPLLDTIERQGEPQDLPKIPAEGAPAPEPPKEEEDA